MSLFDFFKKKDKPKSNDDLFDVFDSGDSTATSSTGDFYSQSTNQDTAFSSSFYSTTEQNQSSSGFYSTDSGVMKEEPSQNAHIIKWLKYAVYSIEAILLALFLHYLLSYLKVY